MEYFCRKSIVLSVFFILLWHSYLVLADGIPNQEEVTLTVINKPNESQQQNNNANDENKEADMKVSLSETTVLPTPVPPPIPLPQPPRRRGIPEQD